VTARTVGIIGGMGPAATVDLMARIIRLSPVKSDQDGIRMLVDNNPHVPDRNKAIAGTGPSPAPVLAAMAKGLEAQGAEFLVMACNTAHAFQDAIVQATAIPFLGIIQETIAAVRALPSRPRQVVLLAAAGCLDAGLYQSAFAAEGIRALVPEGKAREDFMALLYEIKAGDTGASARQKMKTIADQIGTQGTDAVIAGCTEVPLVLQQSDINRPFIDSTERLAQAVVDIAYGVRAFPARAF
jgi:aspartate racemase